MDKTDKKNIYKIHTVHTRQSFNISNRKQNDFACKWQKKFTKTISILYVRFDLYISLEMRIAKREKKKIFKHFQQNEFNGNVNGSEMRMFVTENRNIIFKVERIRKIKEWRRGEDTREEEKKPSRDIRNAIVEVEKT